MTYRNSGGYRGFVNAVCASLALGMFACSAGPSNNDQAMPAQDHSNLGEGSQGLAVHLSPASSFGHFELCDSSDQYTGEIVEARAVGYDDGDSEVCEVTTPLPDASKSCDGATRFEVNVGLRENDGSFNYQCTGGGDWNGNQGACDVSFHAAFLPAFGAIPPPCEDVDFTATADGID